MNVSIQDAAKLSRVPRSTIYNWVREGQLTATKDPSVRGVLVDLSRVYELDRLRRLPEFAKGRQ